MKLRIWLFTCLAPFIATFLCLIHMTYILFIEKYTGPEKHFTIHHGEGFASINYRLYKEGIIKHPRLLYYYARLKNVTTHFRAGTFDIKAGESMSVILETILYGQSITAPIVIPEGKNIYEIAQILQNALIIDAQTFLSSAKDPQTIQTLGLPLEATSVEGYLFPNTYQLEPDTPAEGILRVMIQEFKNRTKNLHFQKDHLTPYEIITLASIVEKETGASDERPLIAGIFFNRLKAGMKLQSDPTTIYGMFEHFDGNIRKKDLKVYSPYNTYVIRGLPPGPICNPGIRSIKAVLSPTPTDYLYFVSQNDGTHQFSKNYEDHRKAVKIYQIPRNHRKGSKTNTYDFPLSP